MVLALSGNSDELGASQSDSALRSAGLLEKSFRTDFPSVTGTNSQETRTGEEAIPDEPDGPDPPS